MKEVRGNIWDYHDKGHWIVITTNAVVQGNGEAVMGAGIALEAKLRFPNLPAKLGRRLRTTYGNVVNFFPDCRIITLPTKKDWKKTSDIRLIEKGIRSLAYMVKLEWDVEGFQKIPLFLYLPRPGCGKGNLDWKDVKPILEKYLDDRFIVVERKYSRCSE